MAFGEFFAAIPKSKLELPSHLPPSEFSSSFSTEFVCSFCGTGVFWGPILDSSSCFSSLEEEEDFRYFSSSLEEGGGFSIGLGCFLPWMRRVFGF
ncbi:hypothetical protein COLO4_24508 [Corchorus olitorius]|uniref:Uncharacterized protein n=1 Tax=Corchorus olitorius TaxID=93759 RepID=A0A1R3I9B3_9ROSI|nr:hypothetical protein COLO4_24508 [Corchorus olitorius]